ncbi:uroporphyrinogen-III C-methyltransferase [Effusibacillus dendaii]|uniref:Uroporphyrinogen-III C-methyltransferase n=1 Tax=Effusibacillus dendaii TaxID=2743772 RepID=A0A7I8D953_9BACL|nr:uroporphyrinogen-III C-methyltransferase [Effusibacillus dendaii]BCJ85050.1 uroporphyrinogen III methyltransferase [Effusibacillus dendaii]
MAGGKVYLVGAGPGDPNLITVKGLQAIQAADVIVYDRLVSPRLLAMAPAEAERIDVGKSPAAAKIPQEQINLLLAEKAKQGKTVVRLKGGDPAVFGRVGEEMATLAEHGVEYEVIPGISSAIGVPIHAGIPVTYRGIAASFAVVTAHDAADDDHSGIHWEQLAMAADTLIFLMGVGRLSAIAERLMRYGRSPETPAALIRWGTWAEQETIAGTLADIAERAAQANFQNPAIIVVGNVVRLRDKLAWMEKKPLFGKRVLVTRARSQAGELASKIEQLGGEVYEFPVIRLAPPTDWQPVDQALSRLESFDWLIFTSVNGVEFFFGRMRETAIDIRRLRGKIAAVGSVTEQALRQRGIIPDLMPDQFIADELLTVMQNKLRPGDRILLPTADIARKTLPDGLRQLGGEVTEIDVYQNQAVADDAEAVAEMLANGRIDVLTFTSSSTVKNFVKAMQGQDLPKLLARVQVASIGPVTTETAAKLGVRVDVQAEPHTIDGLVEAIVNGFRWA